VSENCESASILDGFCEAWLRMSERPETVLPDQEGGLIPDDIGQWFANKGIQFEFRARNQHCSMVERHNTTSCYADSCVSQKIRQTLKV